VTWVIHVFIFFQLIGYLAFVFSGEMLFAIGFWLLAFGFHANS